VIDQRPTSLMRPETDFGEVDPVPVLLLLLVSFLWSFGSLILFSGSCNVWAPREEGNGCSDCKDSGTVYFGYKLNLVSML
jgi:hypothetical protein